ncbi:MAG: hypothetical protein R2695_04355 [Acidimicrobiales bacterium]
MEILTEPRNALVKQYQKIFEFEDVELEFTDDALQAIAREAIKRATGARGLRAILEETLLGSCTSCRAATTSCASSSTSTRCSTRPSRR